MDKLRILQHEFISNRDKISFLSAGPTNGPLLIFVHGWPSIAKTWKQQLYTFAALGFYVVAPDTRGYGDSTVSENSSEYALEVLVGDMAALLGHLGREEAVWIGHDWGCGIVWALAAHHPDLCAGVINLCVPYRTLECGIDALVALVNRDIYPEEHYPFGQFDYQKYYEQHSDEVIRVMEADPGNTIKAIFTPMDTGAYGRPGRTATITRDGGWFGGAKSAPEIELDNTLLDDSMFQSLRDSFIRNGFFGPTSYYLNHAANEQYSQRSVNNGMLDVPVFFIEARFDHVLSTSISRLSEPMRKHCRNLTECSIDAGHWIVMERPQEVNAAIARWLSTKLPRWWPGYWQSPLVSHPVSRGR